MHIVFCALFLSLIGYIIYETLLLGIISGKGIVQCLLFNLVTCLPSELQVDM